VLGKPWVQKNNLHIYFKNPRARTGAFIDHSKEMKQARDQMAHSLYTQFMSQGGREPIEYPVEVNLVFYVLRAHEPDWDNLPAIVMDALQGMSVKGARGLKVAAVLKDDRLVRSGTVRKIVEGDVDYDGEPRTEILIWRYRGASS